MPRRRLGRALKHPTALQFHEQIAPAEYESAAGSATDGPVSIYVHLPFCASPCFYCACHRVITRQADVAVKYAGRLIQEAAMRARSFASRRSARQIHFGGGTPTFLPMDVLAQIMGALDRHFPLTDDEGRDYSIEIDPRTLTSSTLAGLKRLGFNRLSLGIQDFDPTVQHLVNRIQSEGMVQQALAEARALRFSSVNFDLIYGLPGQSVGGFTHTLERVIAMRPDRIAIYAYAHMPQLFKAQRRFDKLVLPDPATRLALLGTAIKALGAVGYIHIGMDHFALPTDSLALARDTGSLHRSFQGYSTHAEADLINLGASAIGQVNGLFVQNSKGLHAYELAIDGGHLPLWRGLNLSRDDRIRGDIIQQIMCRRRIAIGPLEEKWRLCFDRHFAAERLALENLQADELLTVGKDEIAVSPRGEFLLRNIARVFDAYAGQSGARHASSAI